MSMPMPSANRGPIPIAEFAAQLSGHYARLGLRSSTLSRYRRVLNLLVQVADVRTAADIDDDAVRRFIDRHPGAVSPITLHADLAALRAVCRHAVALGLIDAAPAFPTIPPPAGRDAMWRTADLALMPADVARLLRQLESRAGTWEGHRLFALTATVLYAGLRRREAVRLRVGDCELDGATLWIARRQGQHFSKFPPSVRIAPALAAILSGWFPHAGPIWLFPGVLRVGPWTDGVHGTRPLDCLRTAGEEAGIPGLTFEALRLFSLGAPDPGLGIDPVPGRSTQAGAPTSGDAPARRAGPRMLEVGAAGTVMSGPVMHDGTGPRPHAHRAEAPAGDPPGPARRNVRRVPTHDEMIRLMAHLLSGAATWEGHRDYALFGLALFTGLRRGELLHLEVGYCDLGQATIHFPDRPIAIVLPTEAVEILKGWIPRLDGSPWTFPGTRLQGPWTGGRPGEKPGQRLQKAALAAGIGPVTFESLRSFRQEHDGHVDLGDEFRQLRRPAPIGPGPTPRPPGPMPRTPTRTRPRGLWDGSRSGAGAPIRTHAAPPPKAGPPAGPKPQALDEGSPPVPLLTLGDSHCAPFVIMGRPHAPLGAKQYKILRALHDAWKDGRRLRLAELQLICGDARQIVKRMADSDADLSRILDRPGSKARRGVGYGLVDPRNK